MERLLAKNGIGLKPSMRDESYETPFDILYNALMCFSWDCSGDGAQFYPLIFFDAVSALFDGLLNALERDGNTTKRRSVHA